MVTAIGTPNKALVMYWGIENEALNLPMNSSLSVTLDESLNTKTSVVFSNKIKEDTLYINGKLSNSEADQKSVYLKKMIKKMREMAKIDKKVLVVSKNSFPSSAGLASSASGSATAVFALSKALDLNLSQKDLSILTRQISGSGCRSLMGGFVKWDKGTKGDGSDSYAVQIANEKHWPEFIDIIAIVNETVKKISSSDGHKRTMRTSELFKLRPKYAENEVKDLEKIISKRDFAQISEIIMKDSNNMHATMLDSYPPIFYLNDASREIIYAIHQLNESEGKNIAAYTFDAGANAHIMTLKKYEKKVRESISKVVEEKMIISSGQGSGPRILKEAESLIDSESLKPK